MAIKALQINSKLNVIAITLAYAFLDIAVHAADLIESFSKSTHLPLEVIILLTEAAFSVIGFLLFRKLWPIFEEHSQLVGRLLLLMLSMLTGLLTVGNGLFLLGIVAMLVTGI